MQMQERVQRAISRATGWRRTRPRSEILVFFLLLLACFFARFAHAEPELKPTQYEVEAAYLFNFGKFVVWPGTTHTSQAPFLICVLGDDPFGPVLDRTIAGETVGGRPVRDKRIARPQDATGCSILYISSSESARLSNILPAIHEASVLTVSDIPDFVQRGGMIQFVLRDGRVRFEVNLSSTQSNGLSMSSELLKVAVEVVRGGGGSH